MRRAWPVGLLILLVPSVAAAGPSAWPVPPELAADRQPCVDAMGNESGASCIVLYALAMNLLETAYLTPQGPPPFCPDIAKGFTTTPTVSPYFDQARFDLAPTPMFVEVAEGECDTRFHPGYGVARDVEFREGAPLLLSWYLSADEDEVNIVADPTLVDSGALPCMEARATLLEGWPGPSRIVASDVARRSIISSKVVPPSTLDRKDPCASGEIVEERYPNLEVAVAHEFPFALRAENLTWRTGTRPMVHVEWHFLDQDGHRLGPRAWNVHTGPEFRPRVVLPVTNPLWIEAFDVVEANGTLQVNGSFMSPFGSQDVDPTNIHLQVFDPAGRVVLDTTSSHENAVLTYGYHGHGGPEPPLEVSFIWAYARQDLAAGEYRVRVEATNWQGSANVSAERVLFLPGGEASGYAPLPFAWPFVALAVALALRRRR